jgi:predicted RNA binding protein YcfA (HicA-like mRNA interferase family)
MGNYAKLIRRILDGRSDANIEFSELCGLLLHLGFVERVKGGHHIYRRHDVEERIILQRDGSQAKPYQVRQVRSVMIRYKLGEIPDV